MLSGITDCNRQTVHNISGISVLCRYLIGTCRCHYIYRNDPSHILCCYLNLFQKMKKLFRSAFLDQRHEIISTQMRQRLVLCQPFSDSDCITLDYQITFCTILIAEQSKAFQVKIKAVVLTDRLILQMLLYDPDKACTVREHRDQITIRIFSCLTDQSGSRHMKI